MNQTAVYKVNCWAKNRTGNALPCRAFSIYQNQKVHPQKPPIGTYLSRRHITLVSLNTMMCTWEFCVQNSKRQCIYIYLENKKKKWTYRLFQETTDIICFVELFSEARSIYITFHVLKVHLGRTDFQSTDKTFGKSPNLILAAPLVLIPSPPGVLCSGLYWLSRIGKYIAARGPDDNPRGGSTSSPADISASSRWEFVWASSGTRRARVYLILSGWCVICDSFFFFRCPSCKKAASSDAGLQNHYNPSGRAADFE